MIPSKDHENRDNGMLRGTHLLLIPALVALLCPLARGESSDDPASVEKTGLEFFERKIRPLLTQRCYACHSQAKKIQGGLRLDSRAAALQGGDSGPAIVPGMPDESLLVEVIGYAGDIQMPPTGKLPAEEIALLTEWVRRGAPQPADNAAPATRAKIDFDAGRKFWSFQRPQAHRPPPVKQTDWSRRAIDPFILASLEQTGLHPAQEADRRVLIRRASFDLLGLPPTPDEVEQFVNDPAENAYEQLIDRLLASPRYGERWARYWLDMARYTDKPAPWENSPAQAWLYRDWVVRALNEDLPYDQFVCQQLAADALPDTRPQDQPALGFIGLSPVYWKELKLDKEVIKGTVAEEWEERIDALGRTFLGLSLACARCHDHKFDPVSTEDYYALAGVLASTRLTESFVIPREQASVVQQATQRVQTLQGEIQRLESANPRQPEAQPQINSLRYQIERVIAATPNYHSPRAFGVDDAALFVLADGPDATRLLYKPGEAINLQVQIRGNPSNLGTEVPRRFLTVLSKSQPDEFKQGSGRLDLARAIVGEGMPLSGRVIVNRVWKHHFGRGLVESTSDFGTQGARPSHPELLDDLTVRFVQNGWSLKWLHREILQSATYRQAGTYNASFFAVDPENRRLWRMSRRRLDVESWRDAMLQVCGTLNPTLGGPAATLADAGNNRRTIYGSVDRYEPDDMLRLHDFPDAFTHSPNREPTTTALQQLFVLNSPFLLRQATALAARVTAECPGDLQLQVSRVYQLLFGRNPTSAEWNAAQTFLKAGQVIEAASNQQTPSATAWKNFAQVLLGSNEFLFVD